MRLQVDEGEEAAASAEITLGSGTERGRSLVALYVLSIPLPPREATWHGEACGARWVDARDGEPLG
jgi:hypothetical protein